MTIDDLKNVRRQKLRIEALQDRIERLRSRAEYNQRQLGECGRSDPTRDRLAEYAAEMDELERELTGEMITLEKHLVMIDTELVKLPSTKWPVLNYRYCYGLTWKKTADKTGYSIRQAIRIAEEGIKTLFEGTDSN